MIDIRLIRTNPELVKENIKKKFQDEKLVLVDEVIELDAQLRTAATEADTLRNQRNVSSKQIGTLMAQGKKEEAEEAKRMVASIGPKLEELQARETHLQSSADGFLLPAAPPVSDQCWQPSVLLLPLPLFCPVPSTCQSACWTHCADCAAYPLRLPPCAAVRPIRLPRPPKPVFHPGISF